MIKKGLVGCLVIAFLLETSSLMAREARPSAEAIIVDIPIRIVGMATIVVGTAFAIVSTPFALGGEEGAVGRVWDTLFMDPVRFTFTRPMGKFDSWKEYEKKSSPQKEESPLSEKKPSP